MGLVNTSPLFKGDNMGKKKTGKSKYAFFEDVKNQNKTSKEMGLKQDQSKEAKEKRRKSREARRRSGN